MSPPPESPTITSKSCWVLSIQHVPQAPSAKHTSSTERRWLLWPPPPLISLLPSPFHKTALIKVTNDLCVIHPLSRLQAPFYLHPTPVLAASDSVDQPLFLKHSASRFFMTPGLSPDSDRVFLVVRQLFLFYLSGKGYAPPALLLQSSSPLSLPLSLSPSCSWLHFYL